MNSLSHPREGAENGYNHENIGDNPSHKYSIVLSGMVSHDIHDLEDKPAIHDDQLWHMT
jgi:hypothetical protein